MKESQVYTKKWSRAVLLQLRKEISKRDPFRWANVTDHEQHMTNAKCCDEDSPFLWRYRSRLQPEHYPGPVYDVHLTDWAPTYDDHAEIGRAHV